MWRGQGWVEPGAAPVPVPTEPLTGAEAHQSASTMPGFQAMPTDDLGPVPSPPRTLAALMIEALERNPSTRMAWESARAAAGRMGMADSLYLPRVKLYAEGDHEKDVYPAVPAPLFYQGWNASTGISMTWLLADFGRREAAVEAARHGLEAANLTHNREIERVVFGVQQAYFRLDAQQGLLEAAGEDLDNARIQLEMVESRMVVGLATRPALLESRQQFAKAQYQFESTKAGLYEAQAGLAVAVGVPAGTPIVIQSLQSMPLPKELDVAVESVVVQSLAQRPDIQAAVAREREARDRVHEAEADFLPTVSMVGNLEWGWLDGTASIGSQEAANHGVATFGSIGLEAEWSIFEGWERTSRLYQARAEEAKSRAALQLLQLAVSNEVWSAYFDVRASRSLFAAGEALLASALDEYEAVFAAYANGLATISQLVLSESDLFDARATLIRARAEYLDSTARLAFASGAAPVSATSRLD